MPWRTGIRIRSSPIVEVLRFDGKPLVLRSFAGYKLRENIFCASQTLAEAAPSLAVVSCPQVKQARKDTGEERMNLTIRRYAARMGAVALCTAALCSMPMFAQGGGGGMRMTPDERVAAIDKAVSLTDEQKPKVKAIIEADQKRMMDLRNSGGDMQTMRPKMMEIRTQENTDIKALLTDDQKTKYDAYVASMPMGRGRGNGGGNAPPPAPPAQQ